MLDSFTSHISYAPKEFPWAPEVSFSKISFQPGIGSEQLISRISFKELKSPGNAHRMRYFNKQMDMIWLHTKFVNLKLMANSNFSKEVITGFSNFLEFKWIPTVFWLPHKVKGILAYCMSKMGKFHVHFSCAKFKNTAHANKECGACADSTAHFLYFFKNLRRFGLPRAKALGILCM